MKQTEKPRVYAFIDSQNLNLGVQKFGWKLDWRKFRQFLEKEFGVTKAFMFIGYIPENEALYEQMHDAGYAVVLKPTFDLTRARPEALAAENDAHALAKEQAEAQANGGRKPVQPMAHNAHEAAAHAPTATSEEKKPVKGNIDAELVLWAMKEMSNYEKAIIVSGDGDFYSLVEYLEAKGRLLHVLAPSGHYSSLYNNYDSYVVRLDQFRRQLTYYDHRKHKKSPSE